MFIKVDFSEYDEKKEFVKDLLSYKIDLSIITSCSNDPLAQKVGLEKEIIKSLCRDTQEKLERVITKLIEEKKQNT